MNTELKSKYDEYRRVTLGHGSPASFKRWMALQDEAKAFDFKPLKNGGRWCSLVRDGFTVNVTVKPNYDESQHWFLGEYTSEEGDWKTYVVAGRKHADGSCDDVSFTSRTTIRRHSGKDRKDRDVCQFFRLFTPAAEHAAAFYAMGYSKSEATRLGEDSARASYKRAEAFNKNEWSYADLVVRVSRAGVELSEAITLIESDGNAAYLADATRDKIDEALTEARKTLAMLLRNEEDEDADAA